MANFQPPAHKIKISDLSKGDFKRDNNQAYLDLHNEKISKVNLIGIVVNKSSEGLSSLLLDDSSGKIMLRFFEEKSSYQNINVGDLVLVIGFIREFNQERYVSPQIIKKIKNKKWLELRKKELKLDQPKQGKHKEPKEKSKVEKKKEEPPLHEKVIQIIKKLDSGEGVSINKLSQEMDLKDLEKTIELLLERGEIFEIEPGKIKVLE